MLECCSPAWSSVAVTLINLLESVKRRYTKRLPGFQTLPYDERYALLGLDRLELRRLRADLILCYKIIRSLVLLSHDSFFTFICNSRTLKLFTAFKGLLQTAFFRCSYAENLELATRRCCFGCSFVVVY